MGDERVPLEPGHFRYLIARMEKQIVDWKLDVIQLVREKDFESAYALAIEIDTTEFWIAHFEYELRRI